MLSSNADISLAGIEFQIDKDVEGHYDYIIQKLAAEKQDISGLPGMASLDNDIIWQGKTDWVGGEGNKVYYPEDDLIYYVSGALNPRNRGYIMARPHRDRDSLTPSDNADRPFMTVGGGLAWIAGSRNLFSSPDAVTWTDRSSLAGFSMGETFADSNFRITACAGDIDGIYFAAYHSGASGTRGVRKLSCDTSGFGTGEEVVAAGTGKAPYAGMTMMDGRLYGWTGRRLHALDVFNAFPLGADDQETVYDTKLDPPNANVFSATWWADCITAEASVIMFMSNNAQSYVWEYKTDSSTGVRAARPFATIPYGFTIKAIAYEGGNVYFAGHWSGNENVDGYGALYSVGMNDRKLTALKFFRKETNENLQMQELATSYGSQILVAGANTGRIFVYDREFNAVSLLDDLTRTSGTDPDSGFFVDNDDRIGAMLTYGQRRIVTTYQPDGGGSTWQVFEYKSDHEDNRETGFNITDYTGLDPYVEEGRSDWGYPMERKLLHGAVVTFKPLISGQHIAFSYAVEGSTSFTTVDTLDFGETGADIGRKFFPISTTSASVKAFEMSWRVTITSDTGVLSPIVKAVFVGAEVFRKKRRWSIIVRVKDEQDQTRAFSREWNGGQVRDRLRNICETGDVVEFIDGFRYKQNNAKSTHSVTIKQMDDVISEAGEGSMRLLLEELVS